MSESFEVFVEIQMGEFISRDTRMVKSWDEVQPLIKSVGDETRGMYNHDQNEKERFLTKLEGK